MSGHGDRLRVVGALATVVVGAVHLQQYADFIKNVPTIGVLFLLSGLGAGVVCLLLATRARVLGALAGIGVSVGALVALAISRYAEGGLFDYVEPALRAPVLISVVAELIAVASLAACVVGIRSSARRRQGRSPRATATAGR